MTSTTGSSSTDGRSPRRASGALTKELGLFDVYAISTGAMFSSGFFLLPGVAVAETGSSAVFAYLLAGIFIVPAMLSVAELSTAMPRAGGAYYFLDRALGPAVGTVGGLGAWVALVLKTAFALVGMGAYLALLIDVPVVPVALVLTFLFAVLNIVGAKETSALQRVLVTGLVAILTLFVIAGLMAPASDVDVGSSAFFTSGLAGFMGTVGLVFVSYTGLTKVSSVAEEIRRPERNIPLGMALSLATATVIYVVGVWVLVRLLEVEQLAADLTPVASATRALPGWLGGTVGLGLVVAAAVAAFASTGNAGILSASRFPLAMSRDGLVPESLGRLGRFGTPTVSIGATAVAVALCVLFLDVESIAKLASAFVLVLFALLNLAVVVMRESRIEAYIPPFKSPLYPWMQIFGMLLPFWLIAEMGELAILFSLAVVAVSLVWFFLYVGGSLERSGAIFHAFERFGRRRFDGLDLELRQIVMEQGLRDEDSYEVVVAAASVVDLPVETSYDEVIRIAAQVLGPKSGTSVEQLATQLREQAEAGWVVVAPGVALPHVRLPHVDTPRMALIRSRTGVDFPVMGHKGETVSQPVHAIIALVGPGRFPGRHLRLLGHLAFHLDDQGFLDGWRAASNEEGLKSTLLNEENYFSLAVTPGLPGQALAGTRLSEASLPDGTLVVLIRRSGSAIIPDGSTVLAEGDVLSIIGEASPIAELSRRFSSESGPPVQEVVPLGSEGGAPTGTIGLPAE